MPLPDFDSNGDLPVGIHPATLEEVIARFGTGTPKREVVTATLLRIYHLVQATGKLDRFILFGSYVTNKPAPNDVDIVLVMLDNFSMMAIHEETRRLFDHQRTENEIGASVFWIRPGLLLFENIDGFLSHWQTKRDQTQRGIVEVIR